MAQAHRRARHQAYWPARLHQLLEDEGIPHKHGCRSSPSTCWPTRLPSRSSPSFGIRSVPIVRRGKDWANGQVLKDVARVAGIKWGSARCSLSPSSSLPAR